MSTRPDTPTPTSLCTPCRVTSSLSADSTTYPTRCARRAHMTQNQTMLPIGLSDLPGEAMVKLYCPKCMDIYNPKSSRHHHTDGAYFGSGFPHMLFMVHPEYRPKRPINQFFPRLYGFKIHPLAYQLQQQAANSFKTPVRPMGYNNGKR
ncbi:unnamed protein product [Oppiella nova]|uniref:Casein kinase II subunit beta n=1 Tax=Oppiella nova TaxID=334625 RepID=A0A7R9QG03_9ACAR|nr:unnamed protein product [Oppiella nova]CAG2164629.1 unnamed protein product [Oppiella nova]